MHTLRLQQVLADPAWLTSMTAEDCRALTPLIYHHVNPYGDFALDMDKRLVIAHPLDDRAAYLGCESLFSAKSIPKPSGTMRVPGNGAGKPHLFLSAQFPPTKPKHQARRTREYLTPAERERLMSAARKVGRYGERDATLMLLMDRQGLRVAEVSRVRWEQVDMHAALLHVRRLQHGVSSVHPLHGPALRALRRLKTRHPGMASVFLSERVTPLTERTIHPIGSRAGEAAALPFPVHPHMLRHACGFDLANRNLDTRTIQHSLGHRNMQHTVRYTELAPQRLQDCWDD